MMMMFCEAKLSKQQSNTTTGEKYSSACSLLKTKTKVKEKTLRFDPNTKKEIGVVEKKRSKEDSHTRFSFFFHFGFGVSVFDTLNKKTLDKKKESSVLSSKQKRSLLLLRLLRLKEARVVVVVMRRTLAATPTTMRVLATTTTLTKGTTFSGKAAAVLAQKTNALYGVSSQRRWRFATPSLSRKRCATKTFWTTTTANKAMMAEKDDDDDDATSLFFQKKKKDFDDDDDDILSLLCQNAARHPNRPAIASGVASNGPLDAIAFAKLFNFSYTVSQSNALRDVSVGDRVGVYCTPNAEFVASVYAIWMRGGIVVPVSAFGDEKDRAHVANDSGMKTCLVPPRTNAANSSRKKDEEDVFTCGEAEIRRIHKIPKWALKPCEFHKDWLKDVRMNDSSSSSSSSSSSLVRALILYTSGTTGQPKGVLHTRQSLYSQAKTLSESWEISKKDRLLHCLPLHHVHGFVNGILASHASGATVEFTDSFKFDPRYFWRRMRNSGPPITMFYGVPTMYAMALRQLDVYDNADRRRREKEEGDENDDGTMKRAPISTRAECAKEAKALRLCVSGSAACPTSILDQWNALTENQSPLLERYGMTEIGMALSQKLDFASRVPGSVGEPLPNSECMILDEATNELLVKGPGIFKEYWNNSKATKEAFTSDGYFKTGDVVSVSNDKKDWRIVGRASVDVLKVGGEKVSALEIEARVLEGLGRTVLKEVAVFGEADEHYGERAVAIVAPTDEYKSTANFSENSFDDEVKAWTRQHLTSEKWITKTYVVESIPRNAMGKVNKKSLKATFSSPSAS